MVTVVQLGKRRVRNTKIYSSICPDSTNLFFRHPHMPETLA
jgi:hypothetical protein